MPKFGIAFLVIFGLIFTSVGGFFTYNTFSLFTKGELTQSEIKGYSSHVSDGTTMYTPEVKYKCAGVEYNGKSDMSSSSKPYDIGEKPEIYCIGEKYIFKNGFDKYFGLFFLIPGLIVLFIPVMIIVNNIRRKKLKEELLRIGEYISVKVSFVGYNTIIAVNGRNPMYFLCNYHDETNNKTYEFKSYNYWKTNLEIYVKVGDERKVYFNRMNMKKYYVDQEDIPKEM